MTEKYSPRWFSTGVPVRVSLNRPLSLLTEPVVSAWMFFTDCASSKTMTLKGMAPSTSMSRWITP